MGEVAVRARFLNRRDGCLSSFNIVALRGSADGRSSIMCALGKIHCVLGIKGGPEGLRLYKQSLQLGSIFRSSGPVIRFEVFSQAGEGTTHILHDLVIRPSLLRNERSSGNKYHDDHEDNNNSSIHVFTSVPRHTKTLVGGIGIRTASNPTSRSGNQSSSC